MTPAVTAHFMRDRFTWQSYLMLAYFAYLQAALGPLMPFLREELDLNYSVAGFHFSAFALGMVLAGATGDRAAARWGRWRLFWGGGGGMAIGAGAFVLGTTPAMTIGSAFVMGFLGTFLLVMIQSTLSDHHGANRAIALTEANLTASIGAGLAPFLIGTFQRIGLGWRAAPWVGILVWVVMAARFHDNAVPASQRTVTQAVEQGRALPRLFWRYWLVLFLVVSIEWSIVFWGAEFLEKNADLTRTNAATIMSVYFLATVLGRIAGSRLTHLISVNRLLLLSIALAIAGFASFWLASVLFWTLLGLFVAGLGIANLFPLSLSIASSVVEPHQSDTASGRISLGSGLAILTAPQVLGSVADYSSIQSAYGVVAVFLLVAFAVTAWTNRTMSQGA